MFYGARINKLAFFIKAAIKINNKLYKRVIKQRYKKNLYKAI